MKNLKSLLIILLLNSCANESNKTPVLLPNYATNEVWSCERTPVTVRDLNKKDILVIGDSISIAYTPFLRTIETNYNILHNYCNAAWSGYTAYKIDQYLVLDSYEVIIFNNGIWDLVEKNISVEHYISNLRKTALKIKEKTKRPIFINTTYSIDARNNSNKWNLFNYRATQLMQELEIEVVDMYSVSFLNKDLLTGDGTHYQDAASMIFAETIAEYLK